MYATALSMRQPSFLLSTLRPTCLANYPKPKVAMSFLRPDPLPSLSETNICLLAQTWALACALNPWVPSPAPSHHVTRSMLLVDAVSSSYPIACGHQSLSLQNLCSFYQQINLPNLLFFKAFNSLQ